MAEVPLVKCPQMNAIDDAVRQQAITWANVHQYLCCHMALLGHNELHMIIILQ